MAHALVIAWIVGSFGGWVWTTSRRGWSWTIRLGGGVVFTLASTLVVVWLAQQLVSSAAAAEVEHPRWIEQIRSELVTGCTTRGIQRGADTARVGRFCDCVWEVMSTGLTLAEYAEMERAADAGEAMALPQMQRLTPSIKACPAAQ